MSQLLTLKQAGARLSLSWQTVYELVHAGKIPAIRITNGPRGVIRIDEAELERYVATRRPIAEPSQPPVSRRTERAALGLPERHEFT